MIERLLYLGGGIVVGAVVTMLIRMPDGDRIPATSAEPQATAAFADAGAAGTTVVDALADVVVDRPGPELSTPRSDVIARINSMATLAATDPERALQQAEMLDSRLARRLAYERIGAVGIVNSPTQILALAEKIDDVNLRASLVSSGLAALARTDPTTAIEQLTTLDAPTYWEALFAQDTIARLAEADPLALLKASDRMALDIGNMARAIALSAYASLDPDAALQLVDGLPGERERILQAVAAGRARRDPASVMAWVSEVAPASRSVAVSALSAIGETDPDQLLEIALRSPTIHGFQTMAAISVDSFPERISEIADTLLAAGEAHRTSVTALLHTWARTKPQDVIDWMANNAYAFDPVTWREVGRTVSQQDAAAAAEAVSRFPLEIRNSWYEGIASNLADQHPTDATRAILRLPESPGRDRAIGSSLGVLLAMGEPIDVSLLEAFTSPAARDAAIREIEGYVQTGNVHLAEQLLPHIGDPALREEFRALLDRRRG